LRGTIASSNIGAVVGLDKVSFIETDKILRKGLDIFQPKE
jgi:hypothetical protein